MAILVIMPIVHISTEITGQTSFANLGALSLSFGIQVNKPADSSRS